jgi:amino acid permease
MTGAPPHELKDPHLEDAVLPSKADDTYPPPEYLDAEATKRTSIWSKLSFSGADESNETQRGMQSRHLTMIGAFQTSWNAATTYLYRITPAIGGTIGTGIFLSAGSVRGCLE